jgi:hypothetical protein
MQRRIRCYKQLLNTWIIKNVGVTVIVKLLAIIVIRIGLW